MKTLPAPKCASIYQTRFGKHGDQNVLHWRDLRNQISSWSPTWISQSQVIFFPKSSDRSCNVLDEKCGTLGNRDSPQIKKLQFSVCLCVYKLITRPTLKLKAFHLNITSSLRSVHDRKLIHLVTPLTVFAQINSVMEQRISPEIEAITALSRALQEAGIKHMIIGGQATRLLGNDRETKVGVICWQ